MYAVEKRVIIGSSHKIHACHSLTHYITEYKTRPCYPQPASHADRTASIKFK